ncbi:uncharacterized protein LOC125265327 isoform X2 [Megalobrama amblycephala]|uniref:uncharacterized protein LOC125265327 isoform X2 n=1 Tax=Megalobrama amblycephala TaxID=75352 RepID=UPI0020143263|nr:uncharacterized protein LOC125265327 isoform X2 [Megalobrama amblycephala]
MYVILFIVCFLFYKPSMQQQYSGSILQMGDVTAQVGDDVTFYCFHPKDQMNRVMWFKQTLGEKPAFVASSYHWSQDSVVNVEFKKTKRFKVNSGLNSFNLTIERTVQSDSATYYCAGSFSNLFYFGVGTNLVLRGEWSTFRFTLSEISQILQPKIHYIPSIGSKSKRIHILQQSRTASSDGNVTLQCTIQNEQQNCGGEHRVYWFRHGSGKSRPGIIYAQESCKNSSVTASPTRSCVYNLSMRNINPGTYYCAVVTCGEILFGHGINLDIDDEHKDQHMQFYILIGLAALLIISFITNVLLCVTKTKVPRDL